MSDGERGSAVISNRPFLPSLRRNPRARRTSTGQLKLFPWIAVAYRGPAYTDTSEETAALDAIARMGFGRAFSALSEAGDR